MTRRVFIDGQAGTTGLRIRDLLAARDDLEVVEIERARRKDETARRECLNAVDLVVLCLPDEAAREACDWIQEPGVRVLDASCAHRVAEGWVYGLPELESGQRDRIRGAQRVSNPGCYATALVLTLRPLIDAEILSEEVPLAVHALSGYSGGGRPLIERWEDPGQGLLGLPYEAPYAIERLHKHMPEVVQFAKLRTPPVFRPAVGPFRCGMRVEIPLHKGLLRGGSEAKDVFGALEARYADERFVRVAPLADPIRYHDRSYDPRVLNDTNALEIAVIPHAAGHVLLVVRLDNLGKGAAGAAVQNLNLMLGLAEATGLE